MRMVLLFLFATSPAFADGFMYAKGEFTRFKFPGSTETMAFDINERNQIVGWYRDTSGSVHGFIKTQSGLTSIDYPSNQPSETAVTGINNRGTIVGSYWDGFAWGGFALNGSSFTPIDFPGAISTQPFGINNDGTIVGFYWDGYATHGFVYKRGQFMTLDVPGAIATQPYGINDKGQIVGGCDFIDENSQVGFLYERGSFTRVSSRYGINDRGRIAGDYDRYLPNGAGALGINNRGDLVGGTNWN